MNTLGKKIFALLLTAVCLIGVLPLTVFGATEQVCYPAQGVWYPNHRYSKSSGAFITENGTISLIVPLFGDEIVYIVGVEDAPMQKKVSYYLDANFQYVAEAVYTISISSMELNNVPENAVFVTIPYELGIPIADELLINDYYVSFVQGEYTLAHPHYCEDIVVPDPPITVPDGVQIQPVLDMWDDILTLNATPLTEFYNHLIKPMGLIIGIPILMALIGLIIFAIGGKKR